MSRALPPPCVYPGVPPQCSLILLLVPYRFLYRSLPSPASIHTGRQVISGGKSVLLWLMWPPREGCGLDLRPANGSDALEALCNRECIPTTGSIGPRYYETIKHAQIFVSFQRG